MDEVATISVKAAALVYEYIALLGFVLGVYLRILPQLMRPMGELALLLVWAEPILDELFAELALFLVLSHAWFRKCL